mgnify:CR=1 FL=1
MKLLTLRGWVVRGDGRGRLLGFPTANLELERRRLPALGVYAVEVGGVQSKSMKAVCNVGRRPSVAGSSGVHVEIHIPGFRGDLYGRWLTLRFMRRLRPEKKFGSLRELKAQIARDVSCLNLKL